MYEVDRAECREIPWQTRRNLAMNPAVDRAGNRAVGKCPNGMSEMCEKC